MALVACGDSSKSTDAGVDAGSDGGRGGGGRSDARVDDDDAGIDESDPDAGGDAGLPRGAFEVDDSLEPAIEEIAGIDGGDPRALVSVGDDAGRRADFVAREMVLVTDDDDELAAVMQRWNGKILRKINPGGGEPKLYLLRINPSDADPAMLDQALADADTDNRGQYRASSAGALRLLAAIASESSNGAEASANWVFYGDEIARRSTTEGPAAAEGSGQSYDPDAFNWPYMRRGGEQDTGTAEAWRLLEEAGRTSNRVSIAILDGGFSDDADYAGTPMILPEGQWNVRNPHPCGGGTACPWHGTFVASAALAMPDDETMAAGSGGPIADPIFVQMPSPDFFAFVEFAVDTIPEALGRGPAIINMSASAEVPAGLCLIGACAAMDAIASLIRRGGSLVVASAGNKGIDVDGEDCFLGICWEGAVVVPCELNGVMCVGGMRWNSNRHDPGSNYGSDTGSNDSVDIFGPFGVWVGPDPEDDPEANEVHDVYGTSFAAPFVAGVAGLVWAADPSLGPGQVARILRDTAHTDSDSSRVHRRVNAYAAVREALGGNAPPFASIISPVDDRTYSLGNSVPLAVDVDDDMDSPTVTWSSNVAGTIGTGEDTATTSLPLGDHVITATVSDGDWTTSDSVEISIANDPPVLEILTPTSGTDFFESTPISLVGRSVDVNNRPTFTLPDDQVGWRVDDSSIFALGHEAMIPGGTLAPGSYTITFEGTDGVDTVTDTVSIDVLMDPMNLPPSAEIYTPGMDPYPAQVALGYATDADAGGSFVEITLYGRGNDPEFGNLTGTSLEWSVTVDSNGSPNGSAEPSSGTGTTQTFKLYVGPAKTQATFTVTLTAIDTDDNAVRVSDVAILTVNQLI
jgi:hypothetical protein